MIVLVEGLIRGAAPLIGLRCGLGVVRSAEHATGGDADLDERAVVRATVEIGPVDGYALLCQSLDESALDGVGSGRSGGLTHLVGVVSVVCEVAGVVRADHVEVQVQRDVSLVLVGQALHVLGRANESVLLGTPERETHRVGDLGGTAHLECGLEYCRRAGSVVVDAGAVEDAVEMRTGDHHVLGGTGGGLRNDVATVGRFGFGDECQRHLGCGQNGRAVLLADTAGRNPGGVGVAERARIERSRFVVDDDRGGRSQFCCDGLLHTERAHTARHDRDGSGQVEAGVIGCLAAVCTGGSADDACGDPLGRGSRRVTEREHRDLGARQRESLGLRLEGLELEFRGGDLEPGRFELRDNIIDTRVVTGGAGRAVSVVLGGDGFQLFEVPHQRLLGDRGREPRTVGCGENSGRFLVRGGRATGQNQDSDSATCKQGNPHSGHPTGEQRQASRRLTTNTAAPKITAVKTTK